MFLAGIVCAALHAEPVQTKKPNIIYILADDLGYGELGCYGQKLIKTPNIDKLAVEGKKFTNHYSPSPVCAPTRCSILTGQSTRISWVRENREFGDFSADGIEGQDPLPEGTYTVGSMLQNAGYTTACIGKWGLGGPGSTGEPNKQGFDYFFGYLCQRQAHNYYPTHLWENDKTYPLNNHKFNAHQAFPNEEDPADPINYDKYKGKDYSPDFITAKALDFIGKNKEKPFFLYLAYTLPHVSLQVPDADLIQYDGVFTEKPYLGNQSYLPHIRPKSAYAAMISRLDTYVGQVMDRVKGLGLDKNTLVMFTSDNGPSWVSGVNPDDYNSTLGLRGRKAQIWEGGIRIPMIARWPGRIAPGSTSAHVSSQFDLMATLAELVGTRAETTTDGVSFLPTLINKGRQKQHDFIYWEFVSHRAAQAVRIGNLKAIRFNRGPTEATDTGHVYVYDLGSDPAESKDVSDKNPDFVKRASAIFASRTPAHYDPWNW